MWWLLLIIFSAFRMPPWLPLFAIESNGVDPSWQFLLNEAGPRGWTFGRDLFFTYGPFGFIHARMYHPETWTILILAWVGISVVVSDLVWRVLGHGQLRPMLRMICGVALIELMSRDAMATCFSLHALIYLEATRGPLEERARHERSTSSSLMCLAGWLRTGLPLLLLAAMPWAKFSYFVTASFLGCMLTVGAILQRRFPWRAVVLFFACPFAWTLAGGTLAECREFILVGFQLAGGYSAAMGLTPETTAGLVVVISACFVVLLLPVWLVSRLRLDDWRMSVPAMLFFHGLLFITWKSCFVRYHAERIPVFLGTALPLLAYGWLASRQRKSLKCATGSASTSKVELAYSQKPWHNQWQTFLTMMRAVELRWSLPALLAAAVVLVSAGAIERVRPLTFSKIVRHATAPLSEQVLAVAESVRNPRWRQKTHDTQLAKIRDANPIPTITGSVDVFPSKLLVAFAHGLQFQPRPIMQSYAAFTPPLIQRDSAYFQGPSAPDHVLISVDEIDGRLPTLEDSRAWLELLSNYELTNSSYELLRLSRTRQPRLSLQEKHTYFTTMKFGEWLQFPESLSGPVWCRIRIKSSLPGRFASIAYRLPELRIHVQTAGQPGGNDSFRLIPGAAESGFLVSPIVQTREDLIRLWSSVDQSNLTSIDDSRRVTGIACFIADAPGGDKWTNQFFNSEFSVELFEIHNRESSSSESAVSRSIATRVKTPF
jgi:hypothetical protein